MSRVLQVIFLILLLPSFVESVSYSFIPFSIGPLSLGRFTFILSGILLIIGQRKFKVQGSNIFLGVMIILVSNLMASFLSGDSKAVTRIIANILLLIGARGCVYFYSTKIGMKAVSLYFIASLAYWLIYVGQLTLVGGKLAAYNELFLNEGAINHHIVGMSVSLSSVFVACRFFLINGKMKMTGYLIILGGAIICFITESRSNTLFTLLSILIIYIIERRTSISLVLRLGVLSVIGYLVLSIILDQSSSLSQRFDLSDKDYQERTTEVRIEMVRQGLIELITNPMGKGAGNTDVVINQRSLMLHNQYLTYAVGGGFLSLIGIVLWLRGVFTSLSRLIKLNTNSIWSISFETASMVSIVIFQTTIFTLEFTNLLFFQIITLSILVEINLKKYSSVCNRYYFRQQK